MNIDRITKFESELDDKQRAWQTKVLNEKRQDPATTGPVTSVKKVIDFSTAKKVEENDDNDTKISANHPSNKLTRELFEKAINFKVIEEAMKKDGSPSKKTGESRLTGRASGSHQRTSYDNHKKFGGKREEKSAHGSLKNSLMEKKDFTIRTSTRIFENKIKKGFSDKNGIKIKSQSCENIGGDKIITQKPTLTDNRVDSAISRNTPVSAQAGPVRPVMNSNPIDGKQHPLQWDKL